MNREILFKAKRKDNGEWVEGYYLNIAQINSFICTGKIKLNGAIKGIIAPKMYAIDINTLCQYTGLTDKNGQKIWENDILCGRLDEEYPENITYKKVVWDMNGFCTKEECSTDFEPLDDFDAKYFETCGNIFDNPELLEVEE